MPKKTLYRQVGFFRGVTIYFYLENSDGNWKKKESKLKTIMSKVSKIYPRSI